MNWWRIFGVRLPDSSEGKGALQAGPSSILIHVWGVRTLKWWVSLNYILEQVSHCSLDEANSFIPDFEHCRAFGKLILVELNFHTVPGKSEI